MCGINGIYNKNGRAADSGIVNRMRETAGHRGPDDHGLYVKGPVGLGFNRLSIIDLSGGHQPMSNEDGTVWIVFNGEIYNFTSLHDDLVARGHQFRTRSDTETIIHAWEEYGPQCVEKLRGMFAFAIWDERRKTLFGARDRLGIKPFYYFEDAAQFVFASEMKSLLEHPALPRDLDPAALHEFLRRRYVIAPNTMLRGVRKLPPGHAIQVSENGSEVRRYWEVSAQSAAPMAEEEALERLDTTLREVMRMHLVADVPLGAFLSGGLDSSCLVGLMAQMGVRDIKTFSVGYDTPESELGYARIVAARFGTDHHEYLLTPVAFRDILPKIVWHMDEPVGDTASIPLFYLSEFARRKVTVALSGEGSDEIFGGYPIYTRMMGFERWNRIPGMRTLGFAIGGVAGDTKIRKYAEMLGRSVESRYGGVGGLFSESQVSRLFPAEHESWDGVALAYRRCARESALSKMSYVDLTTWLADDLLVKADRMSMANSLEVRVPFLDHVLVDFATGLPECLRVNGSTGKYLLKKWAESLLPREIVYRTKKGFPVPTRAWFRGDLAAFARETLLASGGIVREFLDTAEIERLLAMHQREDRSDQIYALLVLDSWHSQFVRQHAFAS